MFYMEGKKAVSVFQKKVLEKRGGRNPKEKQEQLVFLLLEVLQAPEFPQHSSWLLREILFRF